MRKDKEYYRKLVSDIAEKYPHLDWAELLGFIKEGIENDITSSKEK